MKYGFIRVLGVGAALLIPAGGLAAVGLTAGTAGAVTGTLEATVTGVGSVICPSQTLTGTLTGCTSTHSGHQVSATVGDVHGHTSVSTPVINIGSGGCVVSITDTVTLSPTTGAYVGSIHVKTGAGGNATISGADCTVTSLTGTAVIIET